MPMYKFRDCLASEVSSQEIIEGSFLVCRDTGDLIYDSLEGERVPLSKSAHLVNGSITSELFPQDGHMYYSLTDNQVAIYHNGTFQSVNTNIIQYTIANIEVDGSGTNSFNVSLGALTGYANKILGVVGDTFSIDSSIKDLESEFASKITFGSPTINENAATVVVNNTATYNWIGTVSVFIIFVTGYFE